MSWGITSQARNPESYQLQRNMRQSRSCCPSSALKLAKKYSWLHRWTYLFPLIILLSSCFCKFPHPSTNQAQHCLTSVIKRELVLLCGYGRRAPDKFIILAPKTDTEMFKFCLLPPSRRSSTNRLRARTKLTLKKLTSPIPWFADTVVIHTGATNVLIGPV